MSACQHCHEELQPHRVDGLWVTVRTCDWWCRANPSNGGDAAPHEIRDRMRNPSINFPESEEEAAQAIIHQTRKLLFEGDFSLTREFQTEFGFGHTRTATQAEWLNNQQAIIRALLEDVLDGIDHTAKDPS